MIEHDVCGTCYHFEPIGEKKTGQGQCYRYPPVPYPVAVAGPKVAIAADSAPPMGVGAFRAPINLGTRACGEWISPDEIESMDASDKWSGAKDDEPPI